jgi:hypothetical protein
LDCDRLQQNKERFSFSKLEQKKALAGERDWCEQSSMKALGEREENVGTQSQKRDNWSEKKSGAAQRKMK